jgi:hypothetical protein
MFVDKNTLLSGGDGVAQTLSGTSTYSDDHVDLKALIPAIGSGQPLVLRCVPTVDFTSTTVGAKATLQLRAFPVLQSAATLTGVAIATSDVITKAGHGLGDGVHVRCTVTGGATIAGGNLQSRDFFVINATADTFQVSDDPAGPAVDFTAAGTNATFVVQPEVLASTGSLPLARFQAAKPEDGDKSTGIVTISTNPVDDTAPAVRYLYAHVEATNALAGTSACYFQLAHDSGQGSAPFVFHRSGFTVE